MEAAAVTIHSLLGARLFILQLHGKSLPFNLNRGKSQEKAIGDLYWYWS
jgi:hypothetical protein